ncbi:energy-coupling factor transporter transmembrane component T family protein [Micromonosporaceae bacterium Da 78-11]
MTIALRPITDTPGPLGRRNPVAKLGAALLFTLPPLVTLDPLTPAVILLIGLATLPLFGVRLGVLLQRAWPLLVSVLGIVVTLILFAAERTGTLLVELGPFDITTGVLTSAVSLGLRVFAVSIPGVIVFATTDPTDLADALVQNVRLPPRFAIGTLAAFRLVTLMGEEWQMLSYARRARGIDARNPVARVRMFASVMFALLVGAIRRGTRLAVAMDARGFDSGVPRTVARRQTFGTADGALLAGGLALSTIALAISAAAGTFHFVLS